MTTRTERIELDICVDCLSLMANGTTGDYPGAPDDAAHAAEIEARWSGTEITLNCDEDCEGWFSWSQCDGCGSVLGGERHPAVAWIEDKS